MHDVIFAYVLKEPIDSVGRVLDLGLLIKASQQSHSVMSIGMALYLLLSNGSIQEDRKYPNMTKLLIGM